MQGYKKVTNEGASVLLCNVLVMRLGNPTHFPLDSGGPASVLLVHLITLLVEHRSCVVFVLLWTNFINLRTTNKLMKHERSSGPNPNGNNTITGYL